MTSLRIYMILLSAALGLTAGKADAAEADAASTAVAPSEPIKLFDGKTLGDCYTWLKDTKRQDPRAVFRVTNGLLHITGDGFGGIVTNNAYRDYHLVLECRWGDKTWGKRENAARDSGLLIHSNGVDGGYQGIWMPSVEVQIIEGGVGDFILVNGNDESGKPVPISLTAAVARDRDGEVVWREGGVAETFNLKNLRRINWRDRDPDWQDVKGFRGANDVESPGQQWTRLDILADGKRITTFVNGEKVNEATSVSPAAGRIQLQSELAEIFFRRWELYPIGSGPTPAPA
ncbi:MAG TPA: DUF1080 domain-containing protein, partial [Lacipirellula sp.]